MTALFSTELTLRSLVLKIDARRTAGLGMVRKHCFSLRLVSLDPKPQLRLERGEG